MFKYETHLHTSPVSPCARSTPAEMVAAYKARGYTGIIVTDHFLAGAAARIPGWSWAERIAYFASGYKQARREGERCGLQVFFGLEYSVNGTDFVTYGFSEEFLAAHPEIDHLDVVEYSAFVRRHSGYLAQAHPFRVDSWIDNPGPVDPELIDGMEVFNVGMTEGVNAQALAFARQHSLVLQAGSDAHRANLPFASGIMLPEKVESIWDVIEALKAGRAELILP